MFPLLPLLILISNFNSIFPLKVDFNNNLNYYSQLLLNTNDVKDCINLDKMEIKDIMNLNFTQISLCLLNSFKDDNKNFKSFIDYLNDNIGVINIMTKLSNNTLIKLIGNITEKFITNETLIEEFSGLLENDNNSIFLNNIIEIISLNSQNKTIDANYTYEFLYRIFQVDDFFPFFQNLYSVSKNDILDLAEEIISENENIGSIFKLFRKKMINYDMDLITLFYTIFRNYYSKEIIFRTITEFFINHTDIYETLKEVMMDPKMIYLYNKLINIQNKTLRNVKDIIIEKNETMEIFFQFIKNNETLQLGTELLIHIDDFQYLTDHVSEFFRSIIKINSSLVDNIADFVIYLAFKMTEENNEELFSNTFSILQESIGNMLKDLKYNDYGISTDCIDLFNYTYFDYRDKEKSVFIPYFQKYLFDSSRNKANFLTYDNCLENSETKKIDTKYIMTPAFVVGIINEEQKKDYKNSSFYFKYNYIKSYCFPFGYKNDTAKKNNIPMCSDEDYNKAFKILVNFYNNASNITIEGFNINENNVSPSGLENLYGVIGIFFLGLPLIIYIFLLISGNIITRKQIKKLINEIDEKNKNLKRNRTNSIKINNTINKTINKTINTKKIIFPCWYKYLNECFDIVKNGKELFNFSLNNTNFYNVNGLTYIKGLIGISLILSVFGQTYIALVNLPSKEFGIWDYYRTLKNPLYLILFIGYRYCPRILFSCSGYSLIYKYLCYIEQEQGLYFLKFVFLQSYKYILLFLVLIFFRYSMYYIVILVRQEKRPIWNIFKYFIENEKNFFGSFFSFLLYTDEDINTFKQNLIAYFYIPINEVFFFIFGTALISLGYRFKLRIDIVILVLLLILYIGKIFSYYFYLSPKRNVYTTNDYYLFDYGISITHPLYNLNFFLIGMFFGLINYSIQKGITDLEKKVNYNNIIPLADSQNKNDEEEKLYEVKTIRSCSKEKIESFNINELNIHNDNSTNESLGKESKNDNNSNNNVKKNLTIHSNQTKKYKKNNDKNDINKNNSDDLGLFVIDENEIDSKKIEYSEKIKEMPFLIFPIKFSIFHRKIKNKLLLTSFIIISIILIVFFIAIQIILIETKINIGDSNDDKDLVQKLSFKQIIPNWALNFIFLIDNEIAIFITQWINYILYFKQVEIIRSFLNHLSWSFFVKIYFNFCLISVSFILFLFYQTETVIKLNIFNIFLYAFIDIIWIILFMIIFYSCYELPLKKAFKLLLKGKEAFNNDEEEEESDEEEENNEDEEETRLRNSINEEANDETF